jgi:hypothetical protein
VEGQNAAAAQGAATLVFDSGVVAVTAFSTETSGERLYRFDFGRRSLVVAGCAARSADISAAVRGTEQAALIVAASSPSILEAETRAAAAAGAPPPPPAACASTAELISVMGRDRLRGGLLVPVEPAPQDGRMLRVWRDIVVRPPAGLVIGIGDPGAVLALHDDGSIELTRLN